MPLKRVVLERDVSFDIRAFRDKFLSDSKTLEELLLDEIRNHKMAGECSDTVDPESLVTSRMVPALPDRLANPKAYPTFRAFWATNMYAVTVKLCSGMSTEKPCSPFVSTALEGQVQRNSSPAYTGAHRPVSYKDPINRQSKLVAPVYSFAILLRPIAPELLEGLKMETLVSEGAFKEMDGLSPSLAGMFDVELTQPEVVNFRLDVYGFCLTETAALKLSSACKTAQEAEKLVLSILFREVVTQVNILKHYVESCIQLRSFIRSGATNVIE